MTYTRPLDFEKDHLDLQVKLDELKKLAQEKNIDLNQEISMLEEKLEALIKDKFQNLTAWQIYQISRHPERPTTLECIAAIFDDFIELHGDRCFGDDAAIVGGLAWINDIPVTVIGHQRGKDTNQNVKRNFGMPHPEGYRKAYRLMEQSEKFKRPLICFVDTQGAYPGPVAEERGQGWAIAQDIMRISGLKVPIISVIIGEGMSGGALALGVADRVLMLSYATYSVISPYGCSSILYNTNYPEQVEQLAQQLKMTANDLKELGIINQIIYEPIEGAHRDSKGTYDAIKEAITANLKELLTMNIENLLDLRYQSLRKIGYFAEN